MIQEIFHHIVIYLNHHPHSAGLIAFAIAFAEALAVIGTIFPGSVTMSAIGVLIGSNVIPVTSTLIWAICGAILGDFASYALGYLYKERIYKLWPFTKHPKLLVKGEQFFHSHGGKSVIIGRFFGPMRSMVPLVAGTLKMRPLRFLMAAIPSASIWAIAYITPGILLGALSLELPPGIAVEFIAVILAILVLLLFISWCVKLFFAKLAQKIAYQTHKTWDFLQTHKSFKWLANLLTNPHKPENYYQLLLLVYTIICSIIFAAFMLFIIKQKTYFFFNEPIYYLLRSSRANIIDNIMLAFTLLGSVPVMLGSSSLILIWLGIKKYYHTAIHFFVLITVTSIAIEIPKMIWFLPRPNNLLTPINTSSFPSGHTTITTVVVGFLAFLIAKESPKYLRKYPAIMSMIIIFSVGFSRLFLGAHWLSDVISGVFLGISLLLLIIISYRRTFTPKISIKNFLATIIIISLSVWSIYGIVAFKKYKYNYTLHWQTYSISFNSWQNRTSKHIPLYRINRLGHPKDVFNIEFLGNINKLKNDLQIQGWQNHATELTLHSLADRITTTTTKHQLPILSHTYHNLPPVLLMTKNNGQDETIILRIWQSNIKIKNAKNIFYLGAINYALPPHKTLIWPPIRKKPTIFFDVTQKLIPYLKNYSWKEATYPINKRPEKMRDLHWNGKILLITHATHF